MAPALSLSFSVLSGALLLVLAALLLRLLPGSRAARWWAVSWSGSAAAFLVLSLSAFPEAGAALLQGALLCSALGVFAWTAEAGGPALPSWPAALLAVGTLAAAAAGVPGWIPPAVWSAVPALAALVVLGIRGRSAAQAPVRAQARSLLLAVLVGPAAFAASWILLPAGLGLAAGMPLLLAAGAALCLRSLHRDDARLHPGRASPFVVEKTQDTVLFLRADGVVQASNPALKALLEWDEDGLNGCALSSLGADDEAGRLLTSLEQLTFPDWEGTMKLSAKSGRPVPVHVVFRRLHNPAREAVGAVLLLYDLRLPRRLDLSSREDVLTSLSNRRWVLELLEAEFQRVKRYGGPLAALWIEVADLAAIEARFGAEASDDVLRRLGSILRGGLRRTDFCGRVGHREFLAVLPETADDRADLVARRLEKMFALSEEGETTGASLRVGWASVGDDAPTTDAFLARLRETLPTGSV